MRPRPATAINKREKVSERETAKKIINAPKTGPVTERIFLNCGTVFLFVRYRAPQIAPTPEALIRNPSVLAFPDKISLAKTGASVLNEALEKLTTVNISKSIRMIFLLLT